MNLVVAVMACVITCGGQDNNKVPVSSAVYPHVMEEPSPCYQTCWCRPLPSRVNPHTLIMNCDAQYTTLAEDSASASFVNVTTVSVLGERLGGIPNVLCNLLHLRHLKLAHASIEMIDRSSVACFHSLEILDISYNRIIDIANDSFADLYLLQELLIELLL